MGEGDHLIFQTRLFENMKYLIFSAISGTFLSQEFQKVPSLLLQYDYHYHQPELRTPEEQIQVDFQQQL